MSILGSVSTLLDFGKAHPDGFDRDDLSIHYGWTHAHFKKAVHALRLVCAEDDSINLVCEPTPGGGQWRYRLVGTLTDELWWRTNRQNDALTRLRTIWAVNHSLVAGSSGRTIEGRRVRAIDKALGRLLEDIEELIEREP